MASSRFITFSLYLGEITFDTSGEHKQGCLSQCLFIYSSVLSQHYKSWQWFTSVKTWSILVKHSWSTAKDLQSTGQRDKNVQQLRAVECSVKRSTLQNSPEVTTTLRLCCSGNPSHLRRAVHALNVVLITLWVLCRQPCSSALSLFCLETEESVNGVF